ncbi:MAG: site-specific DNA-methyltransferase, partial [Phycisphaerales bacterium]|nr:site-specific DNA-methyltransferase [Phycisphaerales bacterium]
QKPLALMDLLVRACAPPDGLVVDPCCGSGTTIVAALAAGRRAIGFDVNPAAVAIAHGRLTTLGTPLGTPDRV